MYSSWFVWNFYCINKFGKGKLSLNSLKLIKNSKYFLEYKKILKVQTMHFTNMKSNDHTENTT